MISALTINITKKSQVNKATKFAFCAQQFKNHIYIAAHRYFELTNSIIPFTKMKSLYDIVMKLNIDISDDIISKHLNQANKLIRHQLGSDTAKSLIKQIVQEFNSVVGKWKKGKYASLPEPKELDTLYKFTISANPNMYTDMRKRKRNPKDKIAIRLGIKSVFGAISFKLPKSFPSKFKMPYVTIIPNTMIIINIPYEVETGDFCPDTNRILGIDIGVDNFVSCISNTESRSFIIDGNGLKSFNQWVHKIAAKLQSINADKYIYRRLWQYRERRIKSFMYSVISKLLYYCIRNNIGTIVIGKSLVSEYQRKSRMSKKFNQQFRSIPFGQFINLLKYKAESIGIKVEYVDECYTSSVSSLSGNIEILSRYSYDDIKENKKLLDQLITNGKRIKRGLFKDTKLNKVFNADLNGALNIIIKCFGRNIINTFANILDKLSRPIRFKNVETYPVSWVYYNTQ